MAQFEQRRHSRQTQQRVSSEFIERVVQINHVAKVVKGGRRFGFSTIVVVGDGLGKVGVSIGKAKEVPESITKGRVSATKNMLKIKIVNGTVPHEIIGRCGATRVLLRPAVPGTGIIAGKSVRAILESLGVKDILSKTIGSSNAVNVVKATMDGLLRLRLPEDVAEMRGKTVGEMFIAKKQRRLARSEDEMAPEKGKPPEAEAQFSQSSAPRRKDMRPSGPSQQGRPRPRPSSDTGPRGEDSRRYQDRRPDRRPRPAPVPSRDIPPAPAAPPSTPS